jgi:hypothetical protein
LRAVSDEITELDVEISGRTWNKDIFSISTSGFKTRPVLLIRVSTLRSYELRSLK